MRIGQRIVQHLRVRPGKLVTRSRVRQLSEIILEPMAVERSFRLKKTAEVGWSLSAVALYAQTTLIRSEICLVTSCFKRSMDSFVQTFDLNKSMSFIVAGGLLGETQGRFPINRP